MQTLRPDTEVAEHIGVTTATLRNWRVQGKGPRFAKIGRSVRYADADVESWLASRFVNSTSELVRA